MSTHQWNGRGVVARRGVDDDVVREVAEHARAAAPSASLQRRGRALRPRRRSLRSKRAPPSASATRTTNGVVDAGGHHATASAVAHDARRSRASSIASATRSRPASRTGRARASTRGRHEVERDELRVRVLDRRARRLAVVHERLRVHEPGVEMERGAVAQREQHVGAPRRAASAPSSASCAGESTTTSCAPGTPVADDRVHVRHDAHLPARRVGRAGADARDLGRRLVLVARRRTGRIGGSPGRRGVAACRNVSAGSRGRARRSRTSPVSSSVRSSCIDGQGRRVAARSLDVMPVRFVIIGGGPAGNTAATVAASLGAEVTMIERDIDRRRRAPLGLHPEQGDGRDRQRAHRARAAPKTMGLDADGRLDVAALRERIAGMEETLRDGVTSLLESQGVRLHPRHRPAHRRVHRRGRHRRRRRGDRSRRDPALDRLAATRARLGDDRRRAHPHDAPGVPAARDPRASRRDRFGCDRRRVHAHVQRARRRR